ncbi:hypothetical protein K1X76_04540 [bacterium]|nr:hypothetical protein [bacterium]
MRKNLSLIVLVLVVILVFASFFQEDVRSYILYRHHHVFLINALWHFLAGYYFVVFARGVLARYTVDRPVALTGQLATQFLGGMNFAVSLLAILVIVYPVEPQKPLFLFFAAANFSQFALDCLVHKRGYVNLKFLEITIVDGLVTVLNLFYFFRP